MLIWQIFYFYFCLGVAVQGREMQTLILDLLLNLNRFNVNIVKPV